MLGERRKEGAKNPQLASIEGGMPQAVFRESWKDTEAIEPEDLEPRRTELDRNLGTDLYQSQERLVRKLYY